MPKSGGWKDLDFHGWLQGSVDYENLLSEQLQLQSSRNTWDNPIVGFWLFGFLTSNKDEAERLLSSRHLAEKFCVTQEVTTCFSVKLL